LNAFVNDITKACLAAGDVSLPRVGRVGSSGHIPGWNDIMGHLTKWIKSDVNTGVNT